MKAIVLAICMGFFATVSGAVEISQIVFTIPTSAATSAANLRITPMIGKLANWNAPVQSFVLDGTPTVNYFLTKTKTYTITKEGAYWIQVDQDTKLYKNSETTYMLLPSGFSDVLVIK